MIEGRMSLYIYIYMLHTIHIYVYIYRLTSWLVESVEAIAVDALLQNNTFLSLVQFCVCHEIKPPLLKKIKDLSVSWLINYSLILVVITRTFIVSFANYLPSVILVADYSIGAILENLFSQAGSDLDNCRISFLEYCNLRSVFEPQNCAERLQCRTRFLDWETRRKTTSNSHWCHSETRKKMKNK